MLAEGADILCLKKSINKYMYLCGLKGDKGLINYMYFHSFLKIVQVMKHTIHVNQKVEMMHHEKSDKQFLGSCFAKSKKFTVHGVLILYFHRS